jgi:hypothetical protein
VNVAHSGNYTDVLGTNKQCNHIWIYCCIGLNFIIKNVQTAPRLSSVRRRAVHRPAIIVSFKRMHLFVSFLTCTYQTLQSIRWVLAQALRTILVRLLAPPNCINNSPFFEYSNIVCFVASRCRWQCRTKLLSIVVDQRAERCSMMLHVKNKIDLSRASTNEERNTTKKKAHNKKKKLKIVSVLKDRPNRSVLKEE